MAILKNITVKILVNEQPVQEYDGDSEGYETHNHVTKYIEAVSEARFKVRYEMPPSMIFDSDTLTFHLSLDGEEVVGKYYKKVDHARHGGIGIIEDATVTSPSGLTRRPFLFSEIKRLEEAPSDMADLLTNSLATMGTISVKVRRAMFPPGPDHVTQGFDPKGVGKITEVPEKALKGKSLTHSAKFGEGVPCPAAAVRPCTYKDDGVPMATFDFKYCSRKALESMLLIPRSPSPVPRSLSSTLGPDERAIEDLSVEELRALARSQRRTIIKSEGGKIKTELSTTKVKRKFKDDDGDDDCMETLSRPARAKSSRSIETIDLCGDD